MKEQIFNEIFKRVKLTGTQSVSSSQGLRERENGELLLMDIASVSQDEKSSGNGQWYIRVNVLNTTNIFKWSQW